MKAFIEGNLRIVENASFVDKKTGSQRTWYRCYVQDEDMKLSILGSSLDYTKLLGRDCVFTVDLKPDFSSPTLFRVTINDVKPSN